MVSTSSEIKPITYRCSCVQCFDFNTMWCRSCAPLPSCSSCSSVCLPWRLVRQIWECQFQELSHHLSRQARRPPPCLSCLSWKTRKILLFLPLFCKGAPYNIVEISPNSGTTSRCHSIGSWRLGVDERERSAGGETDDENYDCSNETVFAVTVQTRWPIAECWIWPSWRWQPSCAAGTFEMEQWVWYKFSAWCGGTVRWSPRLSECCSAHFKCNRHRLKRSRFGGRDISWPKVLARWR